MPDAFLQLPRASFDSIAFPVKKVSVKGGFRQHTHEYPKAAGGAPEKLGRKLYEISMHGIFDNNLLPPWDDGLWPGALSDLFDRFDQGLTSTLVIPTVGKIQAFCTNWSKEMEVKANRNGEVADLSFLEDQSSAFLVNGLINVRTGTLVSKTAALQAAAAASAQPSVFDRILAALNTVQQYLDGAALLGNAFGARVDQLVLAFESLDAFGAAGLINSAEDSDLLDAMLDAWEAAKMLQQDLAQQQTIPLINYVTPKLMGVGDVSSDVYGTTERAAQIMLLNALVDPFRIPANTKLRVYAS